MLIVFILQNSTRVEVHYLGFAKSVPLGMVLLIAAVGGARFWLSRGLPGSPSCARLRRIRHPESDA